MLISSSSLSASAAFTSLSTINPQPSTTLPVCFQSPQFYAPRPPAQAPKRPGLHNVKSRRAAPAGGRHLTLRDWRQGANRTAQQGFGVKGDSMSHRSHMKNEAIPISGEVDFAKLLERLSDDIVTAPELLRMMTS